LFTRERRAPIRHRDSGGGGPPCAAGWWRGRRPPRNADVQNVHGHTSLFFNNDNEAASHAPPPPRFARFASSSGPPPPLSRGRKVRAYAPSPFQFTARKTRKLRRRSADRRRGYCPSHANECCHSPALRARRALKRSALVCRRSAAALAGANERHRSTPARASWDPASSGVTRIWPVHSVQRVASQYRS